MRFLRRQSALSLTEIAGANHRAKKQQDNHNATSNPGTFRLALELLAKSVPAPELAQCGRRIEDGYRKRDQEYEVTSLIDQSSAKINR
jgi:hypothetical protein